MLNFFRLRNMFAALIFLTPLSRGLLEVFISKPLAYFFSIFTFLFFFSIFAEKNFRPSLNDLILLTIFLTTILISISISVFFSNNFNLYYLIYYLYFIFLFLLLKYSSVNKINFDTLINTVILFLVSFAVLEQLKLITMPGQDLFYGYNLVRPASITGSYLHYPIVISFLLITKFIRNNYKLNVFDFFLFIHILSTFSKMGFFIIFCFFGIFYLLNFKKINTFLTVFFILIIISLFIFDFFFDRFITGFSVNLFENIGRISRWKDGIDVVTGGYFAFGNNFGFYNNFNRNFFHNGEVFESMWFAIIADIGIIGFCMFFLIIYNFFVNVKSNQLLCFIVFISSFFYQYLEVSSILTLLFLIKFLLPNKNCHHA